MINNKDVNIGDHCWAITDGELVIALKTTDGEINDYELCGDWECGCPAKDLDIISIIEKPKGYASTKLSYLN
jgi:hypothetical protein